ncbi:MAG: oligosaccharide flippase family protein [Pseudomonadota bacterium]
MVGLRWMIRGLGILRTVIIAGILFPEDFGRAILAISIVMFVEAITEIQVDYSLIRSRQNTDALNNAAWTLQIIRGLIAAVIVAFSAQSVGDFYEDPLLVQPLYLLAVALFIGGFVNVGIAEFQRDMDFKKVFIVMGASRIASLVTSVVVALITQSFWAILIGYLVQRIVDVVVSFVMHARRPRLGVKSMGEIGKHSKWLMLQGILFQMLLRLDIFLIGKIAGPAALGPYYLAKMIAELVGTEMSQGLKTALFAKFVRQDRDADEATQTTMNFRQLRDTSHICLLIAAPLSLLMGLCATDLVAFALEERWSDAALYLQIFSFGALFGLADAAPLSVVLALGKTHLMAVRQAITLAVFAPVLWFASQTFGLVGAGVAVVMTFIIATIYDYYIAIRDLEPDWETFKQGLVRIAIAAGAMAAVSFAVLYALPEGSGRWDPMHLLRIAASSLAGLLVYSLVVRWQWTWRGRPETFEKLIAVAMSPAMLSFRRKVGL